MFVILDLKFRRLMNVAFFLFGDSPASEFYVPTFRNTLFHLHRSREQEDSSCSHGLWRWNWQSIPKRRHIKFSRRGITHKKEYDTLTGPFVCFLLACHSGCPTCRISHVNDMHNPSSSFHDIDFIQIIFTDFAFSHTALWKNANNKDNESKDCSCAIIKAA